VVKVPAAEPVVIGELAAVDGIDWAGATAGATTPAMITAIQADPELPAAGDPAASILGRYYNFNGTEVFQLFTGALVHYQHLLCCFRFRGLWLVQVIRLLLLKISLSQLPLAMWYLSYSIPISYSPQIQMVSICGSMSMVRRTRVLMSLTTHQSALRTLLMQSPQALCKLS